MRYFILFAVLLFDANACLAGSVADEYAWCAEYPLQCSYKASGILEALRTESRGKSAPSDSECRTNAWMDAIQPAIRFEAFTTLLGLSIQNAGKLAQTGELDSFDYRNSSARLLDVARQAINLGAEFRLSIADQAQKAGCLDFADDQYRHVISLYTQDFASAFRQRAQIGIDDIRSRKANLMCKWFSRC
jgi:hypothetical protein